jgi:hypothetical protein
MHTVMFLLAAGKITPYWGISGFVGFWVRKPMHVFSRSHAAD